MKRILSLVVALASLPALADTLVGKVVHVADGDTVTVLDVQRQQHRVRVSGIDAPDMQVNTFKSR